MSMINLELIEKRLKTIISSQIPGVVLAVSSGNDFFVSAKGNLKTDSQFFIASATKPYVTALILQLIDLNKLKLTDKIHSFLSADQMDGLHVFEGVDYSSQITVEQLLSHNSGLPDYFQAIRKSNSSLMEQIFKGEDQKWDLRQVLKDAKELGAVFPPSFKNKALYSDTNFQILGAIVESILGDSLSNCIDKYICKKINLTKTYLYTDETDSRPVSLNYKKKPLNIPLAMTSFGPDGGIVSTASDGIAFLKGFF